MSQAQLEQLLKPLIKPATLLSPSKSAQKTLPASCESKFGGLPYAEQNDIWPTCSGCNNELMFVAQLKHPQEKSLHTFFYCFECFPWGLENQEIGQWLIRSYQNPDMKNYAEIKPAHPDEHSITSCSCAENSVQTLPDWEVLPSEASEICCAMNEDEPWEIYEQAASRCDCITDYATLIGGYPKWIQGETTKSCKLCHSEMEFFAQIDSEEEADLMWGDCGVVYLFRCSEHKSEFALELQCY